MMAFPISPVMAKMLMEHFEEKALSIFVHPPRYLQRYVDDAMAIIKKRLVQQFTDHLNDVDENKAIQFTVEHEHDNSIAMLDALITKNDDGSPSFEVYRKSTDTDQYLNFKSHQPLQHKLGVIRTLKHRAKTICSDDEQHTKELDHIKKALSIFGYPNRILAPCNYCHHP